ncbi:MAG: hypothetical protein LBU66_05655, partial [Treponema sp.]|nr:hypothetical protein [Treponema sp.]
LVTRQRDKAGNISVESLVYKVQVEADFPNLIGINVRQPRGIYSSTEGKNVLEFSLDFSRAVYTAASPNAHIVISDWERNTLDTNMVTGEGNYAFRVNVVPITRANASSTLWFRVTLTENQIYMPTGITITRIDLAGVMDEYGNSGNTKVGTTEAVGTGGTTFQIRRYDVANAGPPVTYHTFEFQTGNYVHNLNGRQHEVLTWKPVLVEPDCLPRSVSKAGDTAATVLGTDNTPSSRQSITLKFSHDIYKEVGKIYLRPYGSFPVPPVFPFDRTTAADGSLTPSFSDVYNSPNIDTARMCTHGFNIDIDRCTNTPTSCNTLETPALLTNEQLRDYLQMRTFVRNSDGRRMHQRTTTAYQVYDYATRTGTGGDSAATILGTDSQGKLLTTGLDYGPYKLTTQGLVEGRGYAADSTVTSAYNSDSNTSKHLTSSNPGWNPVATFNGSPFMVPDTSSKYVLDYQYSANATTDAVNNIRTALRAAKYRWQEIDVTSSRVTIAGDRRTVTISLEHPLPVGMRWELQFDEGVFVDRAENKVAPLSAGDHWFWTAGVQAPVIRVNRKSLDYRTIPDRRILQGNYQAPPNDTGYNAATNPGNKNATNLDGFNYAHFRMESETPGAAITYTTLLGKSQLTTDTIRTHEFGAIEPAWTGDITTGNAWQRWGGNAGDTGTDTWGTWILPNLVRRAISGLTRNLNDTVVLNTNAPYEGLEYTVTRDGLTSVMQGFGNFWGHRSHNRDATKSQLDGLTGFAAAPADLEGMINISGNTTGNNTLPQGRASKNYVVAQASITNGGGTSTAKGYEGIFKSVLVVNETNNDANKIFTGKNGNVQLYGGTSTSASSIAGFPLLLDTDDVRYGKFPCGRTGDKSRDLIWITTEIVSSYYIRLGSNQNMGGQGSAVSGRTFSVCGDAGYTISGSYGDLSYTWKQETYGTNQ